MLPPPQPPPVSPRARELLESDLQLSDSDGDGDGDDPPGHPIASNPPLPVADGRPVTPGADLRDCVMCGLVFAPVEMIVHQVNAHFNNLGQTCFICEKSFDNRRDHLAHMRKHHL